MKTLVKETPQNGGGRTTSQKRSTVGKTVAESKPKTVSADPKALEEQLKKAQENEAKAHQEIQNSKEALKEARDLAVKAGQEAQNSKEEAKKLTKELEKRKPLTIAEAMVKISEAKALAEKMEFLQDTRKNLSSFTLGSSSMSASLELTDDTGRAFKSSNSDTVKLVLGMLKSQLDAMIQEAEKELLDAA